MVLAENTISQTDYSENNQRDPHQVLLIIKTASWHDENEAS
jgi:hypothetical protein